MKQKITIIIALFVFLSCKEKLIDPPENLIAEEVMTEILYDLALIKGLKSTNAANLEKYNIETMPYIYEKYGIDSLQFVTSDEYYASIPSTYQRMYQTLKDRIEKEVQAIDEERERKNDSTRARNKKVRDSVKKIENSTKKPILSKK